MGKKDDVLIVLNGLLKMDDVSACMLARKDLGGVVPEKIKVKDTKFWGLVKDSTNSVFGLIEKFFLYGIERLYFDLGEYTVIFVPISKTYSLLVIIPSLANIGLIDIEIENSKRKISKLLEN